MFIRSFIKTLKVDFKENPEKWNIDSTSIVRIFQSKTTIEIEIYYGMLWFSIKKPVKINLNIFEKIYLNKAIK